MNLLHRFCHINPELIFWVTGLVYLAAVDPTAEVHYSFCLFRILGLSICPGCGLGHAVSHLLHGNMIASLQVHPLGIFAAAVILSRIITLLKQMQRRPLKRLKTE